MTRYRSRTALAAPILGAFLLLLSAGGARAQTAATGAIAGVVSDPAGEPLPDAVLTLTDQSGGAIRTSMTDHRGRFRFSFLPPSDYTLSTELIGFAPMHLTDVPVRPGRDLQVDVLLTPVQAASPEPVTGRFPGGALQGAPPGASEWLMRHEVLPAERRELRDLAQLSSRTSTALGFEGLPPSFTVLLIDGTPFRPARHPFSAHAAAEVTGFELNGFESAVASAVPLGVDGAEGSSGVLAAHTRAPALETRLAAEARWSGHVLPGSTVEAGDAPDYNELLGVLMLRGSAPERGAGFAAGVAVRRIERPFSRAWPVGESTSPLLGEAAEQGADVSAYPTPRALAEHSIGGFGAAEVRLGQGHRVAASLHFASLPRLESIDALSGLGSQREGSDLVGSVALRSAFENVDNELRASITSSARESSSLDSVPATYFIADALALGSADGAGRAAETAVRLSDALRVRSGGFTFTAGADVLFSSLEVQRGTREEVFFGGLPQLQAGTGVVRRFESAAVTADWSQPAYALFGEARAVLVPGLSLRLGVRAERQSLPSDEVRTDTTFMRLSLADNASAEASGWRISPRAGLSWDLEREHRWILDLEGGMYYERHDPLLLATWQLDDGSPLTHRIQGSLDWPYGAPAADFTARRLLFLEPEFEPIRTIRLGGGLTHRLADVLTVQVAAAIRRTENLPRRTDLNLTFAPAFRDQYGRGVYGRLVQQGTLLAGQAGTGRRVSEYDEIAMITSSGAADYWGVTLGAERQVARGVSVVAHYTLSGSTDDWLGARQGGWRMLTPQGLDDEGWIEGPSDYDIPHRLAAGVFLDAAPVRVGALLRLESGFPFTPGFRYGVDANGDGDVGNDPAFVDPDLPGMAEMLARWPCLAEWSGRFAGRNACRGDAVKALDLAASVQLLRFGSMSTSLMAEALGLLDSGRDVPDAALYLVDAGAEVNADPVAETVTVPLLVNPNFGNALARREPGRRFRIGLSFAW